MNRVRTMAVRGSFFLVLGGILVACGGDGDDDTPAPPTLTQEQLCQQVAEMAFPDATFTNVRHRARGNFATPSNAVIADAPSFCQVVATLNPSPDSDIKVEIWLPADSWNGKYLGLGNGGYAGTPDFPTLAAGLRRGYAVAHTDMGTAPATALDGRVLQGHPEKWLDWGYRSTHLMTLLAKDAVTKYYMKAPEKSYFMGCSTGGGQGLHEAQRFPADYDGIVVGAPGHNRVGVHTSIMWSWAAAKVDEAPSLPSEKVALLSNAVLAACDGADGVEDGIVSRPDQCAFDPRTLQCPGGDAANCLTASQVGTVERIYSGPTNTVTGVQIFPGLLHGSEAQWSQYTAAADPGELPLFGAIFTWIFGPDFDWRTFDYGNDYFVMQNALGATVNALNPDLRAFRDRGGKIVAYQGLNDVIVAPGEVVKYLDSVENTTGQTDSFVRLFNAPGMGHCSGGNGPDVFGNRLTNAPFAGDAERDILTALERWVEHGEAPDRLVASQYSDNNPTTGALLRTRPLCRYPEVAQYNGTGDTNDEASFNCVAPN